jgi:hypothetical protein
LSVVPGSRIAFAQLPGSGVISGSVLEASNNEPVRKAIVTLTWQGSPRSWATSRTDSSGQFKFEGLPPGKYDLRATKAGVGTAIYGATSVRELGELITLEDGEIRAGVKLRFLHSATISGRVLNPHGAETNDWGEYRLDDIAPGQYYLHAEQRFEFGGAEPLTPQFLGGGRDSKDAWNGKYRSVGQLWRPHWEQVVPFFAFPPQRSARLSIPPTRWSL